jgi:hypothetical protein
MECVQGRGEIQNISEDVYFVSLRALGGWGLAGFFPQSGQSTF